MIVEKMEDFSEFVRPTKDNLKIILESCEYLENSFASGRVLDEKDKIAYRRLLTYANERTLSDVEYEIEWQGLCPNSTDPPNKNSVTMMKTVIYELRRTLQPSTTSTNDLQEAKGIYERFVKQYDDLIANATSEYEIKVYKEQKKQIVEKYAFLKNI